MVEQKIHFLNCTQSELFLRAFYIVVNSCTQLHAIYNESNLSSAVSHILSEFFLSCNCPSNAVRGIVSLLATYTTAAPQQRVQNAAACVSHILRQFCLPVCLSHLRTVLKPLNILSTSSSIPVHYIAHPINTKPNCAAKFRQVVSR